MTASPTDDHASGERWIQEPTEELSQTRGELYQARGELAEARGQQAATGGILRAIFKLALRSSRSFPRDRNYCGASL